MPTIGYALVSKTVHVRRCSCGKEGCGPRWDQFCPAPQRPQGATPICVPSRGSILAEDSEQAAYARRYEVWDAAHTVEEPTGGTRVGPLHYFGDCTTLLKRGPRRTDSRIVEFTAEIAEILGLPICKECTRKMAPFEAQVSARDAEPQPARI